MRLTQNRFSHLPLSRFLVIPFLIFTGPTHAAPRLIQPNDLTYDGAYRLPSVQAVGARGGLAYRPSSDTFFTIGNSINDQPLLEIRLPAATPGSNAATAPQATLVKDYGSTLWNGFLTLTSAGDFINGLWWDDANQLLWVAYGDHYSFSPTQPHLLTVDFRTNPPTVRGPWGNSINMRRGWGQCVEAPAALRAITGRRLMCAGMRGSTGQTDSWGPNLIAMDAPTNATPAGVALAAEELMFWPMVTDPFTSPQGSFSGTRSNYPRLDTWSWIEGMSSNHGSYQQAPYGEGLMPAKWHRTDDQGHFAWIEDPQVHGILYFGVYSKGAGFYGAPDEVGNPTQSSQLIQSRVFPKSVNPLGNGYVYSQQGGSRGTHSEFQQPCVWFIDPQEILNRAQGLRNSQISHYNFALTTTQWPGYQVDRTMNSPQDSTNRKPETMGVHYNPSTRKLYVIQRPVLSNHFPAINVFTVLPGAPPPNPVPPTITGQPQDATVNVGVQANFGASATGSLPLTYQWQLKPSGSTTFSDISGATNPNYSVANPQLANSGSQFRCVVRNNAGSATSSAATLTVNSVTTPPVVTGSACNAPTLPITGARIVNVSSEAQLQTAMTNLLAGDTIVLANGTYTLTKTLFVNNKANVTLRGGSGCNNVTLVGQGMDNANFGNVEFGIWSNSLNTTIAHLTIRDTYENAIILNSGAQAPRIYSVKLLDIGSQFIKSNPTNGPGGVGVDNGVLEFSWIEYTAGPPVTDHGGGVGYTNGISAHAADSWVIRGNLFKNLHTPDSAAQLWNPAVLFWNHSANTLTERNVFINVDRAVAYGLTNQTVGFDHQGGTIRNNFVYLAPGLMSAGRSSASDAALLAWDSPNTMVYHNTILTNGNINASVEFRFAPTTGGEIRNNLADKPISLRNSATATQGGNLLTATPSLFVNAAAADLHLAPTATAAIDKAPTLAAVIDDIDGGFRPGGCCYDIGADESQTGTPPPGQTPVITQQPQGVSVSVGKAANFSVTATGTAPLSYRWQTKPSGVANFADITGALSATYSFPNPQLTDSGTQIRCIVSNAAGPTTSNAATLTVTISAPGISQQPANTGVVAGQTATFSITASGAAPLQYQWQLKVASSGFVTFLDIAGATSRTYTTAATVLTDSGNQYRCVVTNQAGSATSNPGTLTVTAAVVAPAIVQNPSDITVVVGQTADFRITASGTQPLSYQWQTAAPGSTSFSNISGATSASFTTAATTLPMSGQQYRCRVTNSRGTATSSPAVLTATLVLNPPVIVVQPQNITVPAAQNVSFQVVANGSQPMAYQWQMLIPGDPDFTDIPGATGSLYALFAAALLHDGTQYRCVVSNGAGIVTSAIATLHVISPTSGTPALNLLLPLNGSSITGNLITAAFFSFGDMSSVDHIEFILDGNSPVQGISLSGTYNFTNLPAGTHTLEAYLADVNNIPLPGTRVQVSFTTQMSGGSNGSLPTPVLNLPSYMSLNGTLAVTYPPGYGSVGFAWTLTYKSNVPASASGVRSAAPPAGASSANFQTTTNVASLMNLGLIPGVYSVTVQAFDANGNSSAQAQQEVTLVSTDLTSVRIYPNPWRSDRHAGSPVRFDNLALGSTVKIFTVSGHWVMTLTPTTSTAAWDLTNNKGDKVASGLYVYSITIEGEKKTGQLAIIK